MGQRYSACLEPEKQKSKFPSGFPGSTPGVGVSISEEIAMAKSFPDAEGRNWRRRNYFWKKLMAELLFELKT